MPNIATLLKAEMARLARKESRAETEGLKRTIAIHRNELAALKRRLLELEKTHRALAKDASRSRAKLPGAQVDAEAENADAGNFRFRAHGMASNRKRLGLSAEDFGRLVGATGQSVYSWEAGRTRPRAKNLAAIAALRGLGKRDVAKRLEALKK